MHYISYQFQEANEAETTFHTSPPLSWLFFFWFFSLRCTYSKRLPFVSPQRRLRHGVVHDTFFAFWAAARIAALTSHQRESRNWTGETVGLQKLKRSFWSSRVAKTDWNRPIEAIETKAQRLQTGQRLQLRRQLTTETIVLDAKDAQRRKVFNLRADGTRKIGGVEIKAPH